MPSRNSKGSVTPLNNNKRRILKAHVVITCYFIHASVHLAVFQLKWLYQVILCGYFESQHGGVSLCREEINEINAHLL